MPQLRFERSVKIVFEKTVMVVCFIIGIFGIIISFLSGELGYLLISGFWLGYGMGLLNKIISNQQ